MEEFKWIFYVLLAVVFLVVRMWLKAFSSPNTSATNRPATPNTYSVPTPPATSYQDILKQMQASGERAKNTSTARTIESTGSAEKRKIEAKSLENTEVRVRSLETRVVPSKEVTRKPSSLELARQSKPRTADSAPAAANYGKLLQNPQNLRTAFILSEIIMRRVDY